MTKRDPEVQRLVDESAIRRCLERYCRGVDRLDAGLIASAYHADATDDHGVWQGTGHDFASFVVVALARYAEATSHTLGNCTISIGADGDTAGADTQVVAVHRVRRDDGEVLERWGGRYVDRFERRDGEWRIVDRRLVHDWSLVERVTEPFPGVQRYIPGLRSPDDVSYGVLADP